MTENPDPLLRIGGIPLPCRAICAPLTGWSWIPFRLRAYRLGADLCFAPMVHAADYIAGGWRECRALDRDPAEPWLGGQIVGRDPETMAEAARRIAARGIDWIDINFACTRGRPAERGEGAALLTDPARVGRIVAAVRGAAGTVPVSVKLRAGPDPERVNAPALARIAEAEGAAAVTVHGRTTAAGLSGPICAEPIAAAKAAVRIPVIANGGIRTAADAVRLRRQTGADACMIGRGAMRRPWLFDDLRRGADPAGGSAGDAPASFDPLRQYDVFRQVYLDEVACARRVLGRAAFLYARQSGCVYFCDLPGAARFRERLHAAQTLDGIEDLVRTFEPDGVRRGDADCGVAASRRQDADRDQDSISSGGK
ncbi:MAG: tRNA-dihydrouridine synthase [Planctomycetes bacterium]|nr:tRNA-dihydrouridine synthase [Planctomycetota bacterium]